MIESALGWVGDVARFVASLFPRLLVVQASHRAVKYIRGRHVRQLEPGLHVYWPLVTPVESCAVVRQVLNMPTQLLESADGVPVAAGGVVEYEIENAVKFLAECENGYEAIAAVATAAIRAVVTSRPYDERADDQMDRELTLAVRRDLRVYGVRVRRARLSDLARVRPVHLTGGLVNQILTQSPTEYV